jgi:FdhE protein
MSATGPRLAELKRQHPEWEPWLGVVGPILEEAEAAAWDACVPGESGAAAAAAPRLDRSTVAVPVSLIGSLLDRVLRLAVRSGTHEMATLAPIAEAKPDSLAVFEASLSQDADRLAAMAEARGSDAAAFQSIAALVAVPFLQACNRRWRSSIPEDWVESYCPACGSWPAFVEVRGIERARYHRCGRCGSEWHAHGLTCPFCSTTNHHDLLVLTPQVQGSSAFVEACSRCLGYVKVFNRLQACHPAAVMLEDLGGAALDVAALEQGFARPAGAGYRLDVTVADRPAAARLGG